eukprot:gene3885-biopygen17820
MSQRVSCPSCEKKYAGVVGGEDDGGSLPVILPCLCVFCKACALAEEAKAQQQEENEGGEKGGGRKKKKRKVEIKKKEYTPTPCMKCQKPSTVPVADLKLDAALMRQIASSSGGGSGGGGKKAPQCDVCEEEDATKYCNGCSKHRLFCNGCFAAVHKSAKKKSHATIPIEEHLASGPAAHAACGGGGGGGAAAGGGKEPPPTMCHIHTDEALKVYCNDCDVLVCAMCGLLNHSNHKFTPIAEAVGVHRTAIEALMAQVVVSRTHAIAAADAIKSVRGELEGNRDAAFKLVDEEAAQKRALLNTMLRDVNPQRDALKALIKGAHDEKYDALSAQIDALDDIESNSELALALVTATLATASPAELLARKQTFVDGLMQFKEHTVALRRCRISKIGVVLDTSFAEKAADILKMGTLDTERAPQPDLQKQLCAAVEEGKVEIVRKLLAEDDADPSVPEDDYPTFPPIYLAAQEGHADVVELLLQNNADGNQATTDDGTTPVFIAAEEGHVDVVQALVAGNADVNKAMPDDGATPVYIAAQKGHVDVVRVLVARNADVNQAKTTSGVTPVYVAAQNGHVEVVQLLLGSNADVNQAKTNTGSIPVFIAAQNGHVDVVTALVASNADVNKAMTDDGATPVYVAAAKGHVDVVTALVAGNADVNQAKTTNGCTPVFIAAQNGHIDVVKALVAGNADVNQARTDSGATPVFLAAQNGHVDVVTVLVAGNANVNQATTTSGATPVYMAAQNGHVEVVQLLVASNADVNQAKKDGTTPLKKATQKGHTAIVALLKQHGAV